MAIRTILALSVLTLACAACGDDEGSVPDASVGGTIDASGGGNPDAPGAATDATPAIDAITYDADLTPDATPNLAPTASFTINPTCTNSNSQGIMFTSTSTDPENDTLTCAWTFNAGTPGSSNQCNVTGVTFPNINPYTVTLVVDDGHGNTDQASDQIAPCN